MQSAQERFLEFLQSALEALIQWLPRIISGVIIFILSLYLATLTNRIVKRALTHRKVNEEFIPTLANLARWVVIILGTVIALQQTGFNVTAFLTGLGIVGFTIGFALQDISKNFVSGILMLLQQPFDIGDVIEVADYTGTVKRIDLRATELQALDGEVVLIPNSDVYTKAITNFSRAKKRRINILVGVAYESDHELVHRIAYQAIQKVAGLVDDPAPLIVFQEFDSTTFNLMIHFWVDTSQVGLLAARGDGLRAVLAAFQSAGIEMPFPTQRVLVDQNKG